jgi:hypothetical protein
MKNIIKNVSLNYCLFLFLFMNSNVVFSQNNTETLNRLIDQYLAAPNSTTEKDKFKNLYIFLIQSCMPIMPPTRTGFDPLIAANLPINFDCIGNKILQYHDQEKAKKLLEKIVSLSALNLGVCTNHSTCSGNTSCLERDQDDYIEKLESSYVGRGEFLMAIMNSNDERDELTRARIAVLQPEQVCNFNYECESLYCEKVPGSSNGKCKSQLICRTGREGDQVKPGGACYGDLKLDANNICSGPLNDKNMISLYKKIKENLSTKQCGEFGGKDANGNNDTFVTDTMNLFAQDLRAFELMMLLGQNLQQDYSKNSGANKNYYHQIPKRLKEIFLNDYVTQKNDSIKKMNTDFRTLTESFNNLLNTDNKSADTVNFFDIHVIQKEMHGQKEVAQYYLYIYQKWIELQQQYYYKSAELSRQFMVDESPSSTLTSALDMLARTYYKKDTAPLFNNDDGKTNKKRWFMALNLPNSNSELDKIINHPRVIKDDMLAAGFTSNASNKAKLLDPVLPPNGCNIISSVSGNNCGGSGDNIEGDINRNVDTLVEKFYQSWLNALINYYQNMANNLPPNTIIDPDLNIYAGCIQNGLNQAPPSDNTQLQAIEFYKNFCVPDFNKNGKIDENEKLTEKTLSEIAKKLTTYTFTYSFENFMRTGIFNTRSRWTLFGKDRYYKDEFYKDESSKKVRKPEWIDIELNKMDPTTKFYDFRYGTKKKFLNRVRNKYFFLSQLNYLLGQNFDKQIKCIQGSEGGFENGQIVDNSLSPTATPQFIPPAGNNNSGNNNGGANSGTVNGGNGQNSGGNNQYRANDLSNGANSQLALSSGSSGNLNNGFAAQKTQNIEDRSQNANEEDKKSLALGGVAQKAGTGSDSTLTDKKGNVADYNFGSFDGSANGGQGGGGGVSLSDQEQEKVQAALNSNQEPQFSEEDTLFTQITKRYIKNYRTIFRSERRSSAQ